MTVLIVVHAWLRWVILAMGLFGLIRSAAQGTRRDRAGGLDRALPAAFLGGLDLQWLLGVILLVTLHLGKPAPNAWIHGALMTAVVVAGHILRVRLRGADASRERSLTLAFYGVPLALVLLGHLVLPAS